MFNRPLIGEILLDLGLTGPGDIEAALEQQRTRPGRLGELLIQANAVTPPGVAKALARQLDVEFIEAIEVDEIDLDLLDNVPLTYARTRRMLPLRVEDGLLILAVLPILAIRLDFG